MTHVPRFTIAETIDLARKAVNKIDLLGPRGTTLCTMHEIEAMALVIVLSGALPRPGAPDELRIAAPPTKSPKKETHHE